MQQLFENPAFVVAFISFLTSVASYLRWREESGRIHSNTKLVAKHEQQLNGSNIVAYVKTNSVADAIAKHDDAPKPDPPVVK